MYRLGGLIAVALCFAPMNVFGGSFTVSATPDAQSERVKQGDTLTLSVSATATPDPGVTWSWSTPSGATATIASPTSASTSINATFNTPGTITVSTTATGSITVSGSSEQNANDASYTVTVVEVTSIAVKSTVKKRIDKTLTKDDFDIVTNPPGNEDLVSLPNYKIVTGSNTVVATCGTSSAPTTFDALVPGGVADIKNIVGEEGEDPYITWDAELINYDGTFDVSGPISDSGNLWASIMVDSQDIITAGSGAAAFRANAAAGVALLDDPVTDGIKVGTAIVKAIREGGAEV